MLDESSIRLTVAAALPVRAILLAGTAALSAACGRASPPPGAIADPGPSAVTIQSPAEITKPPYAFAPDDEKLLDEVQRGCFNYLWNINNPATGMVPDRTSTTTVSVAGVGFQLSGICVGVERGWITKDEGRARVLHILRALEQAKDNRKEGLFYHYLDPVTAGMTREAYEHAVSTIDSALLFAGMITASSYFGGDVATLADRFVAEANWAFFVCGAGSSDPLNRGYVSLGWKPTSLDEPTGSGELLGYSWLDCGDEHRLVTFLAVAAPKEEFRVPPATYYRLRRNLGDYADIGPMAWFPWSGALFTAQFAHCWLDYAAMGPDVPSAFRVINRPRVDWWENSRRLTKLHQVKAMEHAGKVPTLGENAWGLSASDVASGYAVPGVFPNQMPMVGAFPQIDYPTFKVKDDLGDGTVAPYAAGCSVLFDPARSVAALRYYRSLTKSDGTALLWDDPSKGGLGFRDSFNLGTGWVAPDRVAIDAGPLLLMIENARTGLVSRTFHQHPVVRAGLERLKLTVSRSGPPTLTPGDGTRPH